MLIKDILTINKNSINPQKYKEDLFCHFSLPAFDNGKTPEIQLGKEILSSKFKINKPCILFNKLNVRFKRIWNLPKVKSNYICSSEYLPLCVINNNFIQEYMYYFLISDTVNSKLLPDTNGTSSSHQRIDPQTLLNIEVMPKTLREQQHIVNILGTIDDKIENNENLIAKINESTKLFYINFCDNGFANDVLENYIENYDRQRKPLSSRERDSLEKIYPYYGATEVLDYVDNYLFDGDYLLMGEDGTVADSLGFPIVQRVNEKFWANNHTHILKAKNDIDNNVLELILKNTNVQSIITGAVQPKINQANMNSLKIKVPNDVETLMRIIAPYFEKRQSLLVENKKLNELKQLYLKKFFG